MSGTLSFEPDWISPPGATILDLLIERQCSVREFANQTHRSAHDIARLLSGIERLTPDWASQLAQTLGASPDFWLRREELYRKDFERICNKSDAETSHSWLDELPVKDMIRFGWVDKGASKPEAVMNTLAFFGVPSVDAWRRQYGKTLEAAAYRTSTAFEIKAGAVAAWIRQGEILAQEIDCAQWNPDALRAALPSLRALSRRADPAEFLPALIDLCASCGVAVVVAPLPEGGRASGATKFINPAKALLLLSFRYLNDNEFWFTVFHEAGHLLLHTGDGLFLEGIETINQKAEAEADEFALLSLFTESGLKELESLPLNQFAIARFAKRAGIAPGLVVGRLQDTKRIPFRHFNYLKAKYAWRE